MFAVSVIICSHNPREDYLRRVLDALKAQTLPRNEWELVLVDNASTRPIAGSIDLSWHPHGRHAREDKIGLTHARLRGISESKGGLLVFVDDDNILRADYLQASLKIGDDYPWLGAWNGSCVPEYEVAPSAELRPWLGGLLVEKLTVSVWARMPVVGPAMPTGAGMAVRRVLADYYRKQVYEDPLRQALGCKGGGLNASVDCDMALSGFSLGLGTGRFPELELTQMVSARRITLACLEELYAGFGYSSTMLTAIHNRAARDPEQLASGALKILLLRMTMFAAGKSRAERRIRRAQERGCLAARQDLQRLRNADGLPAAGG